MKSLLLALLISVSALAETKPFRIFGLSVYSNLTPKISRKLGLATGWFFFKWSAASGYDFSKIDETRATQTGVEWPKDQIMVIDIEHWAHDAYGKSQLKKAIDLVRAQNPALRLGYYGEFPRQNYWGRVPFLKDLEGIEAGKEPAKYRVDEREYQKVQAEDKNRSWLAQSADILFPSCYTFYRDPSLDVTKDPSVHDWELFCADQIKTAKATGRPTYVFLWPKYHPSSMQKGLVDGPYFRKQLELAYQMADGIVLYEEGITVNDLLSPWAVELSKFMAEKGL